MDPRKFQLYWPGGELKLDRCRLMGILNVTPDSFSDGGAFLDSSYAVRRAWKILKEGADILDIGAESTRPGAMGVDIEMERSRLWPILKKLAENRFPLPISLDSTKPELVEEAWDLGWIQIVNDVEGLRNSKMRDVVKKLKAPCVIMHMYGSPRTMQEDFQYDDVVKDLITFFRKKLKECDLDENIVLDPGIGFGKNVKHNLEILNRLEEFQVLGHPVMIGSSRKSFIGKVLEAETNDRLEGSLASAALAIERGAKIVRAHDVRATRRAIRMVEAIRGTSAP